jgi:four helix bundle protein
MNHYELRDRTKQFALSVVHLYSALPKTDEARVIGKQVAAIRDVGCRKLQRGVSSTIGRGVNVKASIVEQELDESLLWLELIVEANIFPASRVAELQGECEELLRITVASIKTLKSRR